MAYMWMYCMCVYLKTAPGVTKVVKSVFLLPYIGSSNYETTLRKGRIDRKRRDIWEDCFKSHTEKKWDKREKTYA